jgi:hypothetical protein
MGGGRDVAINTQYAAQEPTRAEVDATSGPDSQRRC